MMKRFFALLLVALLPIMAMAEPLAGGWTAADTTEITEERESVFARGVEKLLGVNYEPIAYLGSQVVAGTNHCYLCRATVVAPGAEPGYALAYLYEDPEGGVTVTQIADLDWTAMSGQSVDEDPDHYLGVTSLEKAEVEAYAERAKEAYLAEDWEALSEMILYPITLYPNVTVDDAEAFLAYTENKMVDPSDREEMEQENCRNMFVNGEGICLGAGEIWLLDLSYMTEDEPQFGIFALSGIVDK